MEQRIDPHTGETFIPKRTNQKFATRKNQIAFNNAKAKRKRDLKSPVQKSLNKNRDVLATVLGYQQEVTKSYDFLLGAGFNFAYLTYTAVHKDKPAYVTFDYVLIDLKNGTYKIIKNA